MGFFRAHSVWGGLYSPPYWNSPYCWEKTIKLGRMVKHDMNFWMTSTFLTWRHHDVIFWTWRHKNPTLKKNPIKKLLEMIETSLTPRWNRIEKVYLTFNIISHISDDILIFNGRYFIKWRHIMSYVIKWRHDVRLLPNFRKYFLSSRYLIWPSFKSFIVSELNLWRFTYSMLLYGKI